MPRQPLAAHVTGFPIPKPQRHLGMHRHAEVEIVHHPAGSGVSLAADGQELAFAAGDTCIYPARLRHDRRFATPGSCLVVRLRVDPPLPIEIRRARLVRGPLPAWLLELVRELAGPQPAMEGYARLALDHRASALLCGLLALAQPARERDPDEALAERAARLIAERFAGIGRLSALAGELGSDYDHLRRAFVRHRGMTLIAWLTTVRARRAQELLASSRLTHAEIARQCGYANARYLNRIFRKQFGSAPGAVRR